MARSTEARVDVTARNRAQRAFDQANNQLRGLNKTANLVTRSLGALGGALAVKQIVGFGKEAVEQFDRIAKSAQTAGVAGETLQELRFAFGELAGTMEREVDVSLQRMNRRLGLAIEGSGAAQDTFGELGIAMTTAGGRARDTEAVLEETLRALSGVEDGNIRAAKASEIFGEEAGPKLAGALEEGIEALERTRDETVGLIGENRLKDAEALNDLFSRWAGTIKNDLSNAVVGVTADFIDFWDRARGGEGIRTPLERLQRELETVQDSIRGATGGPGDPLTALLPELRKQKAEIEAAITFERQRLGYIEAQNRAARELQNRTEAVDQQLSTAGFEMMGQGPDIELASVEDAHAARQERLRTERAEQAAAELEDLRMQMRTREEVELEAHTRRLEVLRNAFENELITKQEFDNRSIELARRTQDRLTEIEEAGYSERQQFAAMSAREQASQVLGELTALTAGVAQHNKTMFQLNKAAAIAEAVVNTWKGVSLTLSTYPYPWNIALAAAHAAAGLAQVSAIRSTSFQGGGGGTTPSAAGSTPSVNNQPIQQQTLERAERSDARSEVRVELHGANFYGPGGAEDFLDLVESGLRDRINDRDVVIVASNSRQAAEFGRR